MTLASSRIAMAVRRRLQTTLGKRFGRFVLVAAGAVAASQLTLSICLGVVGLAAGRSAIAAWLAGAAVSYVLSRWAWERKGKPHLLKETLPFWVVSVGTAIVLTMTTKFANQEALSMGLTGAARVLFVDAAFFTANTVTFLTRFVIFHYVLFAERGSKTVSSAVAAAEASEGRPEAPEEIASEPFMPNGSASRINGSPAWAGRAAERSPARRAVPDGSALPEPGTRR